MFSAHCNSQVGKTAIRPEAFAIGLEISIENCHANVAKD
jgi:hypothetical protein